MIWASYQLLLNSFKAFKTKSDHESRTRTGFDKPKTSRATPVKFLESQIENHKPLDDKSQNIESLTDNQPDIEPLTDDQ
jgi:hypothetical protein